MFIIVMGVSQQYSINSKTALSVSKPEIDTRIKAVVPFVSDDRYNEAVR